MFSDRAQAFRFLLSGGSGFAMYYLFALALHAFTPWSDGVDAAIAVALSVPPTFLLQKHFTFRHAGDAKLQLAAYLALQAACAVLISLVTQLCARVGLSHYLGFFLGGVAGVLFSYVVQSALIFRKRST